MISFKRNKKTAKVEAWKDGKKIGQITTMGDDINSGKEYKSKEKKHGRH